MTSANVIEKIAAAIAADESLQERFLEGPAAVVGELADGDTTIGTVEAVIARLRQMLPEPGPEPLGEETLNSVAAAAWSRSFTYEVAKLSPSSTTTFTYTNAITKS